MYLKTVAMPKRKRGLTQGGVVCLVPGGEGVQCRTARGPDADRHSKLLISLRCERSRCDAVSNLDPLALNKMRATDLSNRFNTCIPFQAPVLLREPS